MFGVTRSAGGAQRGGEGGHGGNGWPVDVHRPARNTQGIGRACATDLLFAVFILRLCEEVGARRARRLDGVTGGIPHTPGGQSSHLYMEMSENLLYTCI